ncbi:thiopeptide-type bacteriocin biosynthesis protein [Virgibacillus dokdonensis]|uniref:thiopeptide-type bacteriocin biosynthesis protein n=1 Tax=Virgibacillus dokdonensis TaxID=302167 RepID=UPI0015927B5D|nr:thiopeptide-type bacteriocin biosynthesis protein [Virgibacillus dokdonensis]
MNQNLEWVYYKIYFPEEKYIDYFVENIMSKLYKELKSNEKVQKWFFIKFIDETGNHIRLRLQVYNEDLDFVCNYIEEDLEKKLPEVLEVNITTKERILPLEDVENSSGLNDCFYELDIYEPEIEKYGGSIGVTYAEDIFEISSNLTLDFMHYINKDRIDRYTIGLLTMAEFMNTCLEQNKVSSFLMNYISYWIGANYSDKGLMYRDSFLKAGQKRIETTKLIKDSLPEVLIRKIEEFAKDINKVVERVISDQKVPQPIEELCFHYIHMMNNRLGIWPVEEAYLAALLKPLYDEESGRLFKGEELISNE